MYPLGEGDLGPRFVGFINKILKGAQDQIFWLYVQTFSWMTY